LNKFLKIELLHFLKRSKLKIFLELFKNALKNILNLSESLQKISQVTFLIKSLVSQESPYPLPHTKSP
jgi:hypothetical protein